jgi:hypothetical protein
MIFEMGDLRSGADLVYRSVTVMFNISYSFRFGQNKRVACATMR